MRERVSAEILATARSRDLSFHQLLTLASIIEKEAVDRSEMPLISAVFWNRLRLEMPLQADPTVQYAVGKDRRRLTRDDLQVESPFNTYRRVGTSAGPHREPRPRGHPGRRQSRPGVLPLLRRDGRSAPSVLGHPRRSQRGGGAISARPAALTRGEELAELRGNAINKRTMAPGEHGNSSSLLTGTVLSPPGIAITRSADTASAMESQAPTVDAGRRSQAFPPLYRLLRRGCAPLLKRLFDLRVIGHRASARARAVHPGVQSSQLRRRRGPGRRAAAAHRVHRHAARVQREPAPPALSPPDRLDPRQPGAPGPRGHQACPARARERAGRRDLPRRSRSAARAGW